MFTAVCPTCPLCVAKLELAVNTKGADTWLDVKCKSCCHNVFSSSPKTVSNGKLSENNVKIVSNALQTGAGYEGYSRAATTISTKPLVRRDYYKTQDYVGQKIFALESHYQDKIVELVFQHYASKGIKPDANGILDVKGSYDGSWMTRGHLSHIGVGCFVDMETGFVLDCEVLSNFCMQCSHLDAKMKKKSITEEQYTEKNDSPQT